jgi:hypothetical protein
MENYLFLVVSIFILFIYIRTSYFFYIKEKIQAASFVVKLSYGLIACLLFIFPYLFFIGTMGEKLMQDKYVYFNDFGKCLFGSAYVLSRCAVIPVIGLLFLIVISLITKLLSNFLEHR